MNETFLSTERSWRKTNIPQVHNGDWIPWKMIDGKEQAKSGKSLSKVQRRTTKHNLTKLTEISFKSRSLGNKSQPQRLVMHLRWGGTWHIHFCSSKVWRSGRRWQWRKPDPPDQQEVTKDRRPGRMSTPCLQCTKNTLKDFKLESDNLMCISERFV